MCRISKIQDPSRTRLIEADLLLQCHGCHCRSVALRTSGTRPWALARLSVSPVQSSLHKYCWTQLHSADALRNQHFRLLPFGRHLTVAGVVATHLHARFCWHALVASMAERSDRFVRCAHGRCTQSGVTAEVDPRLPCRLERVTLCPSGRKPADCLNL